MSKMLVWFGKFYFFSPGMQQKLLLHRTIFSSPNQKKLQEERKKIESVKKYF